MHRLKQALEKVFQGALLEDILCYKNEPLFQDQLLTVLKSLLVDLVVTLKGSWLGTFQ
jgi:hypothetical protein